MKETRYENKVLLVEFNGVEYEIEVRVETEISHWKENHGDGGPFESMANETFIDFEIIEEQEYPDCEEFLKLLEEKIVEDYS